MTRITIPDFSVQWFFLPPFAAVGTLVVVSFFAGEPSVPVDAAFWGLTGLLFIILTVLYGIFIQRHFYRGLLPVQLAAQGLLLCPLSLYMGARMFQWVGVTMAVCGTVVLVVIYYRSLTVFASALQSAGASSGIDSLPIPFAVTDEEGNILSVSDALLQMTKQSRETAIGEKITLLVPIDGEPVHLGGEEWMVVQTRMSKNRYYFQLEEAAAPPFEPMPPSPGGDASIDAETGLYGQDYAARCTDEEIYRIRRYKRWLSVVLLRMVFRGENSPEKEKEIFNAYCRFIKANIRETDTACLTAPRDVYVLMPETQLTGARMAVSKLTDFVPHLEEELKKFEGAAEVLDKTLFFGPSVGDLAFEEIMKRLSDALGSPEGPQETE
jgi:hypothetical protein